MPAQTTDQTVIERGGTNYRVTLAEIVALASGGGGPSTVILDFNGPVGAPSEFILDFNG